jgi:hypothetical protein
MIATYAGSSYVNDANGVAQDGYLVTVTLTKSEADDLLSRYDPSSGTSPSVGDARHLARVILNAIIGIPPEAE